MGMLQTRRVVAVCTCLIVVLYTNVYLVSRALLSSSTLEHSGTVIVNDSGRPGDAAKVEELSKQVSTLQAQVQFLWSALSSGKSLQDFSKSRFVGGRLLTCDVEDASSVMTEDRVTWYLNADKRHGSKGSQGNGWAYSVADVEEMLRPLQLRPTDTVVDVGCGNGNFLEMALQSHPRIAAVGIDPLPFYLQAARELLPQFLFCGGSATNLSFVPDGMFDAYVSVYPINHLTHDEARTMLLEAKRVLKPNSGRIFIGMVNDASYQAGYWLGATTYAKDWFLQTGEELGFSRMIITHNGTLWQPQPKRYNVYIWV